MSLEEIFKRMKRDLVKLPPQTKRAKRARKSGPKGSCENCGELFPLNEMAWARRGDRPFEMAGHWCKRCFKEHDCVRVT